ncbi:hypothetical protein M5D96_005141 [Drosophila gunungcola]|uniref:Uncharacterized protein n=1 Tax=Drosophila gunungcola TaxID=103775 RepID=A0A9P9YVC7_9MUSC|nr:hypothetical protein M5D96_005141 [Drosophila gunungcola]
MQDDFPLQGTEENFCLHVLLQVLGGLVQQLLDGLEQQVLQAEDEGQVLMGLVTQVGGGEQDLFFSAEPLNHFFY